MINYSSLNSVITDSICMVSPSGSVIKHKTKKLNHVLQPLNKLIHYVPSNQSVSLKYSRTNSSNLLYRLHLLSFDPEYKRADGEDKSKNSRESVADV